MNLAPSDECIIFVDFDFVVTMHLTLQNSAESSFMDDEGKTSNSYSTPTSAPTIGQVVGLGNMRSPS